MQFLLSRIEESDIEISRLKHTHTQLNSSYYSAIWNWKKNVHLESIIKSNNIGSEDTEKLNLEEVKSKLYADVMKMNIVQNVDTPIEKIINIINDNEDEKKRKLNSLIIFGLDVEETDKSNKTVNEFNLIWYWNNKN